MHVVRNRPVLKRVTWFVLSALSMAAAGLVARRFSTWVWYLWTTEEPPVQSY
jgi:hypothetical protein